MLNPWIEYFDGLLNNLSIELIPPTGQMSKSLPGKFIKAISTVRNAYAKALGICEEWQSEWHSLETGVSETFYCGRERQDTGYDAIDDDAEEITQSVVKS